MIIRRQLLALLATPFLAKTARAATPLTFGELYVRQGQFSPRLNELTRQNVTMRGFMAPPLKAEAKFFVLTKMPMASCPFCGSEIEWPDDIVVVNTSSLLTPIDFNILIEVSGTLELGSKTDPETGFLSLIRIVDATFKRA